MKDLIALRAYLRKQIIDTRKRYDEKEMASYTDEDSDSYDEMQRLGGIVQGLQLAHIQVKAILAKKKLKKLKS